MNSSATGVDTMTSLWYQNNTNDGDDHGQACGELYFETSFYSTRLLRSDGERGQALDADVDTKTSGTNCRTGRHCSSRLCGIVWEDAEEISASREEGCMMESDFIKS